MFQKFFSFVILSIISVSLLYTIPVKAFETDSGESLFIDEPKSNYHVTAGELTIKTDITKDLVAAGGEVVIDSTVSRNVLATGGSLDINGEVGGSTRVAGGSVTLEGIFNDDVIVAGGTVNIQNATINGDLVVGTGSLTVTDTNITGDLYAGYDEYSGDSLENQVAGEIIAHTGNDKDVAVDDSRNIIGSVVGLFFRELSAIVVLAFLLIFLGRRNRLHIPSLSFTNGFVKDLLYGLLILVVAPIILLFGSALFFPITIPLLLTVIATGFLSSLFLPVYLANLLKNGIFKNKSIRTVVIGTYISLLIFHVLKVVFPIFQILNIALLITVFANLGFLIRKCAAAFNLYLRRR